MRAPEAGRSGQWGAMAGNKGSCGQPRAGGTAGRLAAPRGRGPRPEEEGQAAGQQAEHLAGAPATGVSQAPGEGLLPPD